MMPGKPQGMANTVNARTSKTTGNTAGDQSSKSNFTKASQAAVEFEANIPNQLAQARGSQTSNTGHNSTKTVQIAGAKKQSFSKHPMSGKSAGTSQTPNQTSH